MTADQTIFTRTLGDGPTAILALHCTLAHSGAWRGVSDALNGQATMLAPDMYCHGRSPDWDGEGDFLARMRDATLPLLDKPMHLVGHSFGAVIALSLAAAAPDKVLSLTLAEPVFFAAGALIDPSVIDQNDAAEAELHAAFDAGDWETGARLFNRAWSGAGPKWDAMPQQLKDAMIRAVRVVPACWPSISGDNQDLIAKLGTLTMPTRIIRGEHSPAAMKAITGAMAARMPNAREKVFETAGHMLPITHPKETAAIVADAIAVA